jgi:tight adherence protein C
MPMLLATGLLCLFLASLTAAKVLFAPLRDRQHALERAGAYGIAAARSSSRLGVSIGALRRVAIATLAKTWLAINRKTSEERVRMRLHAAGLSGRFSPSSFLAGQFAVGILFAFFGFSMASSAFGSIMLASVFGAGSIYVSEFLLSRRASQRTDVAAAALPRLIDQLSISMEAGLSFDASLAHLVERGKGPLVDEMRVMLGEIRVGESRTRALKRVAERVPGPEIKAFVQAVVQAEQQGISLASILRAQAVDLRNRRQMLAEERAMKAPVKMLFPIVIFILPVMFIVIIGPAFVNSGDFFK